MSRALLLPAALLGVALLPAPALAGVTQSFDPEAAETKIDPKSPEAVRCRKIAVTGSLVKKDRICKTNAEWAQAGEDARKNADDLITRNRPGQRFE
jgi:hypothetical protein